MPGSSSTAGFAGMPPSEVAALIRDVNVFFHQRDGLFFCFLPLSSTRWSKKKKNETVSSSSTSALHGLADSDCRFGMFKYNERVLEF